MDTSEGGPRSRAGDPPSWEEILLPDDVTQWVGTLDGTESQRIRKTRTVDGRVHVVPGPPQYDEIRYAVHSVDPAVRQRMMVRLRVAVPRRILGKGPERADGGRTVLHFTVRQAMAQEGDLAFPAPVYEARTDVLFSGEIVDCSVDVAVLEAVEPLPSSWSRVSPATLLNGWSP